MTPKKSIHSLEVAEINAKTEPLFPLCELPMNQTGIVRRLEGGREFMNLAASLGFTLGVEVNMVQNYGRGPVIVCLRDTRVALGRGEAIKILVEMT